MLFCQAIAALYPYAIKIRMIQDNLNTHDASAFYENLPADEAWPWQNDLSFTTHPNQQVGST